MLLLSSTLSPCINLAGLSWEWATLLNMHTHAKCLPFSNFPLPVIRQAWNFPKTWFNKKLASSDQVHGCHNQKLCHKILTLKNFKVQILKMGYKPPEGVIRVSLTGEWLQSRWYRWAVENLFVPWREERWGLQLFHQAQNKPPKHCTPLVLPVAEMGGQAARCQFDGQPWLRSGPHHLSAPGSLPSTRAPYHQQPWRLSQHRAGIQAATQLVQGPFPAVETPALQQTGAAAKSTATHLLLVIWHPEDNSRLWTPHPMLLH